MVLALLEADAEYGQDGASRFLHPTISNKVADKLTDTTITINRIGFFMFLSTQFYPIGRIGFKVACWSVYIPSRCCWWS